MKRIAVVLVLLGLGATIWADSMWVGTWVQRETQQKVLLTMTVEEVGRGWKLTYKMVGPDIPASTMTIVSQLDGKDAPLLIEGKPTGQTMAIRKIDSRHTVALLKFQGKETGISKGEISSDGKVLKIENDNAVDTANGMAEKSTQYWDKK